MLRCLLHTPVIVFLQGISGGHPGLHVHIVCLLPLHDLLVPLYHAVVLLPLFLQARHLDVDKAVHDIME